MSTVRFPELPGAWNSDAFPELLKQALEGLSPARLPVAAFVEAGSVVATLLSSVAEEGAIHVRVQLLYTEIVTGCSCGDDPFPQQGECVVLLAIDRGTGEVSFALETQG